MSKFKNPTLRIAFLFLSGYTFLIKRSGLFKLIDKNDRLFEIYVIPHRIYHTFRRRAIYNFPYSYVIDVFTGRTLKNRKGECAMCGGCCVGCQNLETAQDGRKLCKIHKRREWCNVYYPISLEEHNYVKKAGAIKNCGYEFTK